jgi:hypothetical protein
VVDYEKSVLEVYLDCMHVSMIKELPIVFESWKLVELTAGCYYYLGRSMGIGDDLLLGVLRLTLSRFTVHMHDKLTAVGLEKASHAGEQHHWWYECNGGRHHFCCHSLSGSEISEISAFMKWNQREEDLRMLEFFA